MLYLYRKSILPLLRKLKTSLLLLALIMGLSGCGQHKTVQDSPHESTASVKTAPNNATSLRQKSSRDNGCSYFHFLWGRHAELAAEYEKALALYEKSLQCNPDAEFVLRKIPLLLLRSLMNNFLNNIIKLLGFFNKYIYN